MKNVLPYLFLFTAIFVKAQNDNCSGATQITVGTNFASGAITSNNTGATTDSTTPGCNPDAVENVWFKVVVPASGNVTLETQSASNSPFDDSVLTVYSGDCNSLAEIACDDDNGDGSFSMVKLTAQTPGATLYVSVWKYSSSTENGEFQVSAYEVLPPAHNNCSGATSLTVGTDFASGAITSSNLGATTDGTIPSCNQDSVEDVWFKVVVPASGNLTLETQSASNSPFDDSVLSVYSGSCGSLTEIACDDDSGDGSFSRFYLTGQTPGATLYVSVWKRSSSTENGEFQISAYEATPITNNNCTEATSLTVGTDFASGAITSSNLGATMDGNAPSCSQDAVDNVWFKVVIPASGNVTLETKSASNSSFNDSVLSIYNGTCGSLTETACDDDSGEDSFSRITLTGQTPGATLYVSVWKPSPNTDNGQFQISAYEATPPANNNCTEATSLTVGADFTSGAITSTNLNSTTDGNAPSCSQDAVENVWFKVVVPASGNITLEAQEATGSLFAAPLISVYSGICGTLTEIACDLDSSPSSFPLVSLTGQTPGTTLYVSVWKYTSNTENGEFQISAYDNTALSTHELLNNKNNITVFPNPFSDVLNISDISKVKSVTVIDALGKLVKTIEKPSSQLNLNDLKTGLYLVTLKMTDGTTKTIKTIKK
ncbi:T9SS type A sorting domain-containing protein [Chryseobacterium sp. T20]|uniref:T9SS type A sorting domain-containing protein n=1 Tax=Chryseobacterium sp. T20 TaxID=3395375 RepID=UPI0039BC26A4